MDATGKFKKVDRLTSSD